MSRKSLIAAGAVTLALAALAAPTRLAAQPEAAPGASDSERPRQGYLGVGLRGLTPELRRHFGAPEGAGVLVASVESGSAAEEAGIRVGDVLTAIDGATIGSARELGRAVRQRPGETVELELARDGAALTLTARLGERPAHGWHHPGGRSPEEWEEWAERWERWGEEFGERWEEWGERFGERWGEEHAERWERWAEELAERGEDWGELGEEIGREVERALAEVDWDEIGEAIEESMRALDEVDWDRIGDEIERRMDELERRLDELEREREESR